MRVGFIGLGGIGKPMAACIARKNFDLLVFDVRQEPLEYFREVGAKIASSSEEIGAVCDVVLVSLPNIAASKSVAESVFMSAKPGMLYIELSTISPEAIFEIAKLGKIKGIEILDAPVSGGIEQRQEGKLTVMVGGSEAAYNRGRIVLEAFGSNVIHVGEVGSGVTVKIVNNLIALTNMLVLLEGVALGEKAGLDVRKLTEILKVSSGNSAILENIMDNVIRKNFFPQKGDIAAQAIHTNCKDLKLANELAESLDAPLLLGALSKQIWGIGKAKGLAACELASIIKVFEDIMDVSTSN